MRTLRLWSSVQRALQRLGKPHPILLVHSSLSRFGHILGGAQRVVQGLSDWKGVETLTFPTHTYCYKRHPAENAVEYDVHQTPSFVGALTEYFRKLPNVVRSVHPSHSLAARGPAAPDVCRDHWKPNTPCGKGTPYERLIESDCSVLMFGVTMDTYTLFHTAEDAAELPYLYEAQPYCLRSRDYEGKVHEIRLRRQDMSVPRRFGEMDKSLEQIGLLARQQVGRGELLYIPSARALHHHMLAELRRDPLLLVATSARAEIARRFGH